MSTYENQVECLNRFVIVEFGLVIEEKLTVTTASRVAREMMSAQETMPGQASSTAALAVSIRSIP